MLFYCYYTVYQNNRCYGGVYQRRLPCFLPLVISLLINGCIYSAGSIAMRRYIEWLLRESRDTIEILSQDCLTLGANQASTIDTSPNGFTFWMIGTVCHCAQRWLLRLWNETAIPLSPIPIFCHRISVALVGFVSPAIRASHFNLLDSFNDRGCYLLTTSCFYLLFSCCSISTTSLDILIVSSNKLCLEFPTKKGTIHYNGSSALRSS